VKRFEKTFFGAAVCVLRSFSLGNVTVVDDNSIREQRGGELLDHNLKCAEVAVFAVRSDLEMPFDGVGLSGDPERVTRDFAIVLVDDIEGIASDELFRLITEHLDARWAYVKRRGSRIDDLDNIERILDQTLKEGLELTIRIRLVLFRTVLRLFIPVVIVL
jgi:hypothetical protein